MALFTIFRGYNCSFHYLATYGLYGHTTGEALALAVDKSYTVSWDGVSYTCVAQDASTLGEGTVALGNGQGFGLAGNGEPFVIGVTPDVAVLFALNDEAEASHTVIIYQEIAIGATILEEQTVVYDVEEDNCLIPYAEPLITGETYIAVWNDIAYECVATDFSPYEGVVFTAIGNLSDLGAGGNGIPFTVMYANSEQTGGVAMYSVIFLDGSTAASLAIYEAATDEEPEEPEEEEHIVLKDRNGNDILFQGINMIKLPTTGGGTKTFAACDDVEKTVDPDFSGGDFVVLPDTGTLLSKVTVEKPEALSPENIRKGKEIAGVTGDFIGDTEEVTVELALADGDQTVSPSADGKVISGVTIKKPETLTPANIAKGVEVAGVVGELAAETEEVTVGLDFSNGAMEVTPTGEKAFSKVNIPVPETLKPEHIAEGVDIAGIVGTLAAGGGGGNIVAKAVSKYCSAHTQTMTITHNLGVVPDIVFATGGKSEALAFFGVSAAFAEVTGNVLPNNLLIYLYSGAGYYSNKTPNIETTGTAPISNANDKTVTFTGYASGYGFFYKGYTYKFYFIGGLT